MFLFFSKLTGLLIAPSNWLIILFIWWIFSKSAIIKKRLAISITILVIFFGNEVILNKLAIAWQLKPVKLTGTYDAGILLGGIGSFDKFGNGYMNDASDRLIATCALYHSGSIKKIVISAGNIDKNKPKEAIFLSTKVAGMGIPDSDILVESSSRTTFENAIFCKRKIDSSGLKPPYVLVTSALHIPRAVHAFQKAGLQVVPYPCNYKFFEKNFQLSDYLFPKLYIINDWGYLMKEVVGLAGYRLFGKAS